MSSSTTLRSPSNQPEPQPDRLKGLQNFFTHHKFIDLAMHKPIPHETLYYNSGYFYLYGHYYAALVIQSLPLEQQTQ